MLTRVRHHQDRPAYSWPARFPVTLGFGACSLCGPVFNSFIALPCRLWPQSRRTRPAPSSSPHNLPLSASTFSRSFVLHCDLVEHLYLHYQGEAVQFVLCLLLAACGTVSPKDWSNPSQSYIHRSPPPTNKAGASCIISYAEATGPRRPFLARTLERLFDRNPR